MKAKLFVCDNEDSYRSVHNMYTNNSYIDCIAFDVIIDDIEVEDGSSYFNNLMLSYRHADALHRCANGRRYPKKNCAFCSWQNFLLKFENDEVAELHRVQNVLYRHDDCTANRDAIRRFKEDIAAAMAGKPEIVFSEDEDFVV